MVIKTPMVGYVVMGGITVKLAQVRTYPPLQNRLLGHAIGKSVEERVYMASLEFNVKELSEAIERISFPSLP
jgi:hypothetical protein